MEALDTSLRSDLGNEKDEVRKWKAKKSSTDRLYVASRETLVKASLVCAID